MRDSGTRVTELHGLSSIFFALTREKCTFYAAKAGYKNIHNPPG
jgi:hypothetical protein